MFQILHINLNHFDNKLTFYETPQFNQPIKTKTKRHKTHLWLTNCLRIRPDVLMELPLQKRIKPMSTLQSSLKFRNGSVMKNRFMLAPMTNQQSHEDGSLSVFEFEWLSMRAKGQFGLVMTCASHVQEIGKGFSGQLGIWNDKHIEGHKRLASELKNHGSLAVIQLHHAGMRSPRELIGAAPVCPSNNEKTGARALTIKEIKQLKLDFKTAALRAKKAGYDGIEIHGAHGYILAQFLSTTINFRTDNYGGNLTNRSRLIFEIIEDIRKACGQTFLIGLRLSPEKFGMQLGEIKTLVQRLVQHDQLDFLDISL